MKSDKYSVIDQYDSTATVNEYFIVKSLIPNLCHRSFLNVLNCYFKNRFFIIAVILLILEFLMSPCAIADTFTGKVIVLSDGDTVTVLDLQNQQHKVRLAGIDAPEKRQPYGNKAKQTLASMIFARQVDVDWEKIDRYGRLIGKIKIDSIDVGLEMIRLGMAWHYKAYENEQSIADRLAYSEAENKARKDRIGLWRDMSPLAPWEYRHNRR